MAQTLMQLSVLREKHYTRNVSVALKNMAKVAGCETDEGRAYIQAAAGVELCQRLTERLGVPMDGFGVAMARGGQSDTPGPIDDIIETSQSILIMMDKCINTSYSADEDKAESDPDEVAEASDLPDLEGS